MLPCDNKIRIYKLELQERNERRLLRMKQVQALTSLSRSYIYHLASIGEFPKSLSVVRNGNSRAWLESEVEHWIDERIAERDQEGC